MKKAMAKKDMSMNAKKPAKKNNFVAQTQDSVVMGKAKTKKK
jgi:hypothetical protein